MNAPKIPISPASIPLGFWVLCCPACGLHMEADEQGFIPPHAPAYPDGGEFCYASGQLPDDNDYIIPLE